MCTYYYLHHHHLAPCTRDINIVVHYVFCPEATMALALSEDCSSPFADTGIDTSAAITGSKTNTGPNGSANGTTLNSAPASQPQVANQTLTQIPCSNIYFDPSQSVDYNDPCASGGCLASPDCSSGACRLKQLNGCWTCCRCGSGGNRYRWCRNRMRRSPDTFCYHVCCGNCTADETEPGE